MAATPAKQKTLRVIIIFPAAAQPFRDDDVDPTETIGSLKSRVLTAFGLAEGATGDGNQVNYTLYHQKVPLENPDQPVGDLADNARAVQLKLAQQIIQG